MTDSTPVDALHRFPLVPRPHPVRAPLDARLTEIGRLVASAASAADPRTVDAVAWNHAALLASDHHLPELARRLCRHHHLRYDNLSLWDDRTARLALEPLINLARLHLRDHDPDTAITLLTALRVGVDTRADTTVDDLPVRTSRITDHTAEHRRLRVWMWNVLLTEGIRGLAAAGRWSDAMTHAHRHRGIGDRLLDGRQAAVVAHLANDDLGRARRLVRLCDVRRPWERAVAATLTCAIDLADGAAASATVTTMVERYLAVDLDDKHASFTERLGSAVATLARQADRSDLADRVQPQVKPAGRMTPDPLAGVMLTERLLDVLRLPELATLSRPIT